MHGRKKNQILNIFNTIYNTRYFIVYIIKSRVTISAYSNRKQDFEIGYHRLSAYS